MRRYRLLVAGDEDVAPRAGRALESIDPTTGRAWAEIALADGGDVDRAVRAAQDAFAHSDWTSLSPTRRGRLMMRLADLVADHADRIAEIETRDNGKLYRETAAQLRTIPEWLYYFGGLADKIEGRVIPHNRADVLNYTLREPIGVVGLIVPWNSPVLLTMQALAPALAAGNTVVVKPSEHAAASVLETLRLAGEAGFPAGVINAVTGDGEAGAALADHPSVARVAFTGSGTTGAAIAARVGRRLASTTLELGGKSANIVFADADLDAAEAGILAGIFAASGQTCMAGSRALVQSDVYDELIGRVERRARAIRLGDPMSADAQMGPIANRPQLARIETMVDAARSAGADVLTGGARAHVPDLPDGFFYEPTILTGVPNGATIAQEEVFGPVLTAIAFDGEDDAVALANATRYGLAAGVWTRDLKRGHRVAQRLQAGTVWLNLYRAIAFNSPFGGYKASGIGRANGIEAVDAFLQTKSVWCELSEDVQDPFAMRL